MKMTIGEIAFDINEGIFSRYRAGLDIDEDQDRVIYDTARKINEELKCGKITTPEDYISLLTIAQELAGTDREEYKNISCKIVN